MVERTPAVPKSNWLALSLVFFSIYTPAETTPRLRGYLKAVPAMPIARYLIGAGEKGYWYIACLCACVSRTAGLFHLRTPVLAYWLKPNDICVFLSFSKMSRAGNCTPWGWA